MILTPRPLVRETATFRDDRLFIVACEDTYAPQQYFEFFQITRIQIHIVPTEDGRSSPSHVLERLLAIEHAEYDERWLLLDVEHRRGGPHVASLVQTLSEARRQGVNAAICNPCFELWLLLHHRSNDELGVFADCAAVEGALREILGGYNKRRLKPDQFNRRSVAEACVRARRLGETEPWAVPAGYAAQVHRLWEAIVGGAAPHQLPPEFQGILT